METATIIEKIISSERLQPYLTYHRNDLDKAIQHYKSNILVSEAFVISKLKITSFSQMIFTSFSQV